MQYTSLIINSLKDFNEVHPSFKFNEILYSILKELRPEDHPVGWLFEVKDSDIYKTIEKILKDELPED